MVKIGLIGNGNIDPLITLADYFRRALNDEVKLPETSAKLPQLIKVDGVSMMQLTGQAGHYRKVLDNIESTLEKYALQLTAQSPEATITEKSTPARKEEKKKVVVDAQTNIGTPKDPEEKVIKLMPKKKTNLKEPTFNSLLKLPKKVLTDEFKDTLNKEWHDSKGNAEKAKLYTKVKDLLNNQELSIITLRDILSKFSQTVVKEQVVANEKAFAEEIKKEGIDFKINVPLDSLIKGKELLDGKTQFTVDGEFNLMLLTGKNNVDNVSPQDYVKQRAMYLRITGRERNAMDELTKFYSDAKKGVIWPIEKTRWFLNNLFIANSYTHLHRLIENILVFKQEEKKSYKAGLKQAKNLIRAYTRYTVKDKDGKDVVQKTWEDAKINNFIDAALKFLADNGKITLVTELEKPNLGTTEVTEPASKEKITYSATYITKKGKVEGTIVGGSLNTTISGYEDQIAFGKACEVIAKASSNGAGYVVDYVEQKDPKNLLEGKVIPKPLVTIIHKKSGISISIYSYTEKTLKDAVNAELKGKIATEYTITYAKQETTTTKEGSKRNATFHTEKKSTKDTVSTKSGDSGSNKEKKVVTTTPKEPVLNPNSAERYKKTAADKEALKNAKKALKSNPTPGTELPLDAMKRSNQKTPEYSAVIVKETDGTFSCTLNGFNEVVKTTGAKTMDDAKLDFADALRKYSAKIKEENDRAKSSRKKKGKKIHMKPDFSQGELTFLIKDKKTGS